ncbi:MAG TPA: hypothetical protein DIC36_03340 [Gammaproteobacteria bacterium]|nr:hypothetical protein [Gammaproteobacteria bacterium]
MSQVQQQTNPANHSNILAVVGELLDSGAVSQAQIARESGVASGTISQVLGGKYKADPAAVLDKLEKWTHAYEARAAIMNNDAYAQLGGWFRTFSAGRIYDALTIAQGTNDMTAIYTAPGVGKTHTAKHYQKQNNNVWLVELSPDCKKPRALLEEIAFAMGIQNPHHTPSGLRRQIELEMKNTNGLLIIDEAQYAEADGFEALRRLYDRTGCGVALMGNMLVYSKLYGGNTQRSQLDAAQRYSRIGPKVKINQCAERDIAALLNHWDIQDKPVRDLLAAISAKPGGLRSVEKVLRQALLLTPDKALAQFNEKEIKAAWALHGGMEE